MYKDSQDMIQLNTKISNVIENKCYQDVNRVVHIFYNMPHIGRQRDLAQETVIKHTFKVKIVVLLFTFLG